MKTCFTRVLKETSFNDYLADLKQVVQGISGPVILVGHSAGGMLVQKYLETEPAAGAVLIATPTARDLKRAQMSALRNHPWAVLKTVLTGNPDQFYHDTKACRKVLFASDMSPETDKALEQISLQSEPSRVVSDLLNFKSGPPLTPCRALVITAGNDNSVSQETIAQHKAIYGAEVKNYPGKSHELIITPGWESVADDIGQWLTG